MGITGLLPFLNNKSSRRANIREFAGQTVAIDTYCWLHKGAFSCAEKLIRNEPTDLYITYCMKYITMLLSHNIKPILVFDGRYLPAKSEIEKKRREDRSINRKKGAELLSVGQVDQGRNFLRRSVDVTHKMALNLIKKCRERNIDCIVAPYEADAQLAYLNIKNIAQLIVTEDSDLLLFGCIKVLFKMDTNGNGTLIEKDKLHLSMGYRPDIFSIDKFRHMCILSGCDYLPSLPGIGLSKARKFINRTREENTYEALSRLPVTLQMWSLAVTDEYIAGFIEADRTFKYQLVYDPIRRKQVPLNETQNENDVVGEKLDEEVAFQLAIGNIDPMTMNKVDEYYPDERRVISNGISNRLVQTHSSIWNSNFTPHVDKRSKTTFPVHNSTKGLSVVSSVSLPVKRPMENESGTDHQVSNDYLNSLYGLKIKEQCETTSNGSSKTPKKSPILFRKKNPFALEPQMYTSAKKKRLADANGLEVAESEKLLTSRYFAEEEDSSNKVSIGRISVLDVINREETDLIATKSDKFEIEEGKDGENRSCNITIRELKDSSDTQSKLPKISFVSQDNGRSNSDDGSENLEAPKKNYYNSSNSDNSENEPLDINKEYSNAVNHIKQKMLALSPMNGPPCVKKNFYSPCGSEDAERGLNSPYFQNFEDSNRNTKPLDFNSPVKFNRNATLMRSTKKSILKSGLSKCIQGKQQSLLTRFGFQPRPKIQSEKAEKYLTS